MDAIVIRNVTKQFKKSATRKEMTTLKGELVRLILRRKRRERPSGFIPALRGIDLTIPKGKTVGIIGRNGSGKSTLLKLITGIYRPTSGNIEVNGRISALLDLGAGFHPDFTGRENIMVNGIILGMSRNEVKARIDQIIEFSELGDFIDEPIRTYSSGMYMRLAFAVATHVDPDILIIDEILAVGDEHFGRKSMAKMTEFKRSGKTIVLVTHDLGTLQQWCDLAAWIDGGKIRMVGEPHRVVNEYRQAILLAEAQGNPLLAPALAPDGGALPDVQAPRRPTVGPDVSPDRRWGSFELEIERVRLLNHTGQEATVMDTGAPMEICLDYVCKAPIEDATFSVSIVRSDGVVAFGTNNVVDGARFPRPLPPRGTVRFRLEPVCLREGSYNLELSATAPNGAVYDFQKALSTFSVRSDVADSGLVRPPHRWTFEAQEQPALNGAVSISAS